MHGTVGDGRGVTVMLGGDGDAVVWTEATTTTSVILVEIW